MSVHLHQSSGEQHESAAVDYHECNVETRGQSDDQQESGAEEVRNVRHQGVQGRVHGGTLWSWNSVDCNIINQAKVKCDCFQSSKVKLCSQLVVGTES